MSYYVVTYMGLHIIQTFVQVQQHLGKIFTPYGIAGPWRIESPRQGVKIVVVLHVFPNIIRQLRQACLF